jgi:hypothetical protein
MFPHDDGHLHYQNVLTSRLKPKEGILQRFIAKQPGSDLCLTPVTSSFLYADAFGISSPPGPALTAGCCWTSWRATRPGRSWIRSSPDWRVTLRRDFRPARQDPGVRRLPRRFWRVMAGTGNWGEGWRMDSPRHRGYRGSRRVTPNTARSPWPVRVTALCEVGSRTGVRTTGATERVLRRPGQPGWRQQ